MALDLPGYGGSDSLTKYGPNEVLDAVAEAIVMLRKRFLVGADSEIGNGFCMLVGHDWGGIVASRIAMETKGLVDRVVLLNAPPVRRPIPDYEVRANASQSLYFLSTTSG